MIFEVFITEHFIILTIDSSEKSNTADYALSNLILNPFAFYIAYVFPTDKTKHISIFLECPEQLKILIFVFPLCIISTNVAKIYIYSIFFTFLDILFATIHK